MLQAYTDVAWGTLLQVEGREAEAVEKQKRAMALKETGPRTAAHPTPRSRR
jgi:hypothetical protein